ncbi:hypothetical protein EC973_005751 [Apophysomyces ossiformis]|uniref:BZIP domain-containing protein n=1 Tax=Apophysomyces ossiformis TaxID=679940 RepID=A0A8H7BJD7_9FUNG|nr:hypothetical protein EC973_005751 [Apophysomyces ossiformis]
MSQSKAVHLNPEEERKDRNRIAQAAFRARRSKYTQTLEQALLRLDKQVQELQESNRLANERAAKAEQMWAELWAESQTLRECLMFVLAEPTNPTIYRQGPLHLNQDQSSYNTGEFLCCIKEKKKRQRS